ncbi:MAG: transcription antiterminator, partial [Eubacteriales bacterium]|nr:transcription antiterminator [Eubacteriales bacterium]
MALSLNTRRQKILSLLLSHTEYVSPNEIAQSLKVSKRTIYYDIDKINEWLRSEQLPELENVRERGICISQKTRQILQNKMEQKETHETYIFSPQERAKCIIAYIIYSNSSIYIEQLADCFLISRNTIFSDLKIVEKQLRRYDLTLEYHPKYGYYIMGDTIRIRAMFLMIFEELQVLFISGFVPFFHTEEIHEYHEKLLQIAEKLNVKYVNDSLLSIAALFPLAYTGRASIHFSGLKKDQLFETNEYKLIREYFPDLHNDEQIYFSLHLLGCRINMPPEQYFELKETHHLDPLVEKLIAAFESIACIKFENRTALAQALKMHLKISLYRYKYGIQIGNVLTEDIIQQYGELFSITKRVVRILEKQIGLPIPDSETAYLTLHFGSALKISENRRHHLKILIVCVNGISTGNMLKHEVEKLLPFAEIADVRAAEDLLNVQNDCNLIISTLKLDSVVPVITVHPILTEFDKKTILNHPFISSKQVSVQ